MKRGVGNKYDLAIKGDSFTTHRKDYLLSYFKEIYDFFNGVSSSSFVEATRLHENALDRCVTIKIETRPDYIDNEWCQFMIFLGITTVEIGVQSLLDNVLALNNRGHDVSAVVNATRLLKKYGFEVCYHVMTGMYGSSMEKDVEMLSDKLWQPEFSPDALKIYPCILLKDMNSQSKLANLSNTKKWRPLTDESYNELLSKCLSKIPSYVHINRIQRIFSPNKIAKGPSKVIDRSIFKSVSKCLWHRSIAQNVDNLDAFLGPFTVHSCKQGAGFFVEATVDDNVVIGYGRLEWHNNRKTIIRDVRVLGNMLAVNEKNPSKLGTQHKGVGKALIKEMERISLIHEARSILIRPSYGTKEYFLASAYIEKNAGYLEKNMKDDM